MIGTLPEPMETEQFLAHLKRQMNLKTLKYTVCDKKEILRVAVCGGAGSFLLKEAIRQGADAFVSSDFKYHDFFDAEQKMLVADIGHYESEIATKELLYDFLQENFTNIAVRLTEVNTNPIKYL